MVGLFKRGKILLILVVACSVAFILFKSQSLVTMTKREKYAETEIRIESHERASANLSSQGRLKVRVAKPDHNGIPKILHQAFSSEHVYENYRPMINSCLALNPDWTYYLWRDSDARALIADEYPQYLLVYTKYWDNLQRSDAIRYVVLHRFGGIYLDMDVECVQPFHPAVTNEIAFIDQERVEQTQVLWGQEFSAMNSAMGSVQCHPFYRLMADEVLTKTVSGNALATTGPTVLTRLYKLYRNSQEAKEWPVRLLPPSVFSPLMDKQKNWKARCKASLKTNGGQSWVDRGCRMLQAKQWQLDDADNHTVAVHRFLHLGYAFAAGQRKSTFNMAETFKRRIKFYAHEQTGTTCT